MSLKISEIDLTRFEEVKRRGLSVGKHSSVCQGFCVLEAFAYVTHATHCDRGLIVSPLLEDFLRYWNDGTTQRSKILIPFLLDLPFVKGGFKLEEKRIVNWMLRDIMILVGVLAPPITITPKTYVEVTKHLTQTYARRYMFCPQWMKDVGFNAAFNVAITRGPLIDINIFYSAYNCLSALTPPKNVTEIRESAVALLKELICLGE